MENFFRIEGFFMLDIDLPSETISLFVRPHPGEERPAWSFLGVLERWIFASGSTTLLNTTRPLIHGSELFPKASAQDRATAERIQVE